jgi:hypothetical protein
VIARAAVLALMLVLAARAAFAAAIVNAQGELAITLPADLLRKKEVKDHLTSGLTTVFVIAATVRDGDETTKGGARIEVRFKLWEEQYVVSVIGPHGIERQTTFANAAAFERWWSENLLTVTTSRRYGPHVDVRVKLTMLPFSAREQSDTRRWLSRTLSASASRDPAPAQSAEILRILVETSVRRRPLLEREWVVRATREGQP